MKKEREEYMEAAKEFLNTAAVSGVLVCAFFLFYRQAFSEGALYISDLQLHIKGALNREGYSLMSNIFLLLFTLYPSKVSCVAGLTAIVFFTIFSTAYLMKTLLEQMDVRADLRDYIILASSTLFIASIYIPEIYPYFYANTFPTQSWHNSTYLLMRLCGTLVMAVYYKIESHYLDRISVKEASLFTCLLIVANYAKPNFILAFAPMMLCFLIRDFIRQKGQKVMQMIKFGMCVLLSLWILLFQYQVLYPDGGDSGIVFTLNNITAFLSSASSIAKVLCGLIFPIFVLFVAVKKHYLPSVLIKSHVMYLIASIEYFFLTETGYRAYHGNFGWGKQMGAFLLYITSCMALISMFKKGLISRKLYVAAWTLYFCSILSGFVYFYHLLRGASAWGI